MDSNITVCRDLMPPRLLLRLVPPPLLQPQARALARYVFFFDDLLGGNSPGLLCIFHCRGLWDALWALRNSPPESRNLPPFFSLPRDRRKKKHRLCFFGLQLRFCWFGRSVRNWLSLTRFFFALTQVYSFVPIPGAQQHKRPRRRYEEIERMYKCGWNGCEKAYGTLNHLNAHVTMQSHGAKRTPEGEHSAFLSLLPRVFAPSASCPRSARISKSCRKWLDWVSAGSYALVSYTRFRGAAVAWPTAWRLSLSKLDYLSLSN